MTSSTVFALTITILLAQETVCDVGTATGYNYPPPQPPVLLDDPSTPSPAYLPPIFQDEIVPPQLPPIPVPTYLPPNLYPPLGVPPETLPEEDTVVIPNPTPTPGLYQTPVLQARVLNMSCVMDGLFKSVFRVEGRNSSPPPVVDNGAEGCISARSGAFVISAEGSKRIAECGVRKCTSGASTRANMCVVVRMPTVRGLKLPEDGLVTLQCAPQDSIVSHTKHIRLGPTTINKGRSTSNGVVASGGNQRNFDSRIILLRKSGGSTNFDQPLLPGSIVHLGEELVLRAVVQDDGWKFSRMGPVVVRSSTTQKSVTLIEENGCRSAGMKSICPFQPRQLSPLDTVLHFRAFLFQSSSRGDEMLLSVKMLGCLHAQDCNQNGLCGDVNLLPPLRFKRQAKVAFSSDVNDTSNWESQFAFRVLTPPEKKLQTNTVGGSREFLYLGLMSVLCLSLIIILLSIYFKRKNKSLE